MVKIKNRPKYWAVDRIYALKVVGSRVPRRGDLFINKFGKLQRCVEGSTSRRAQPRVIVKEAFGRP